MHPRFAFAALSYLPFLVSASPLYGTTTTASCSDTSATAAYAVATPEFTPTSWIPCGDCTPATVTAASQLVTSVKKDIQTTSFYASTSGLYTLAHQSSVWTVDKPAWVTYEIPCATVYIMPYAEAICEYCIKEVEVVIYINIDIIIFEHQVWTPSGTTTTTATVSAASTDIGYTPSYATGVFGPIKTHSVTVGGLDPTGAPILRYNPESVIGGVGEVVEFVYLANNHTATQSDFDSPCFPKVAGFDSGFRPNPANVPGQVISSFTITDTMPAWFYCAQRGGPKPHCQSGMVFAVNAPQTGEKTLEAFRQKAIDAPLVMPPVCTTTAVAPQITHMVTLGGLVDGKPVLRYNPETVIAKAGDKVIFDFRAANHTVTQSSFDSPCVAIPGGFKTGVQMNPFDIDGLILKEFEVTDTKPLWFYCGFARHCQQGMVFAINSLDKFPEFQAKALAAA